MSSPFIKAKAAKLSLSVCAILVIVGSPYLLTTASSTSICLAEMRLVGPHQKINAARRYLDQLVQQGEFPRYTEILGDECCAVDKGGRAVPQLNALAYFVYNKTHYVHLLVMPVTPNHSDYSQPLDALVVVDPCGHAISRGVDL